MNANLDLVVGLLVMAVPLLAIGYFMLSKQPAVFRFFAALLLVGLGYLTATGAANDIGSKVLHGTFGESAATTTDPASPAPAM